MTTIPSSLILPLATLKIFTVKPFLLRQRVEKEGTGKGREERENNDLTKPSVCLRGR
jgi:hypothetical protein